MAKMIYFIPRDECRVQHANAKEQCERDDVRVAIIMCGI